MMTFNIGDKVKVITSGWGFGIGDVKRILTIKSSSNAGYFEGEGYQVEEKTASSGEKHWFGVKSFTLIEKANVPKNPNVKIINTFVPSWAKWMAMDKSGKWHVYSHEPEPTGGTVREGCFAFKVDDALIETTFLIVGQCNPKDIEVDWKETLHEI